MLAIGALEELQHVCPDARAMEEQGREYVLLPNVKLPPGRNPSTTDALLCLTPRDGYPTRLFLANRYPECGQNWNQFLILDRTWHCWSWKDVSGAQRPTQILAEHLRALR